MRSSLVLAAVIAIASPAVAAETHVVTMAGSVYHPASLTARVGDTIRFVNDDGADHDVLVPTLGHAVDLGSQKPDEERQMTVLKPGTFGVECVLHEHMILTVEVTP